MQPFPKALNMGSLPLNGIITAIPRWFIQLSS